MRHNMNIMARTYLKQYYRFLTRFTNIVTSIEAYSLYKYAIKTLYGIEVTEYSENINKYGEDAVDYLSRVCISRKEIDELSYEERIAIVNLCEAYSVLGDVLTYKSIKNGKLERAKNYKKEILENEDR